MSQTSRIIAVLGLLALAVVILLRGNSPEKPPKPVDTPDSAPESTAGAPATPPDPLLEEPEEPPVGEEKRTVLDPDDKRSIRIRLIMEGQPVPRAEVYLLPLDEETEALASRAQGLPRQTVAAAESFQSGDDGTLLVQLPNKKYVVAARAEGTVPVAEILPAEQKGEFELLLVEECVLTGKVTFEDGSPAAGATLTGRKNVHLERTLRGRTLDGRRLVGMFFTSEATTQADGTYELRGLAQGLNLVEVSLPGFSQATAPMIQVPWWPQHDFVLYARAGLSGLVQENESEDPLEGVLIEAFIPSETNPDTIQAAYSKPDGSFRMDAVRGGLPRIHLRTYLEGYATEVVPIEDLQAGEERRIQLTLEPASPLSGIIRYATGDPVEGAGLRVSEQQTGEPILELRTGADGRFECLNLAPSRAYRIEAGRPRDHERVVLEEIVLPRDPLEIILPVQGVVAGRITAPGDATLRGRVRLGLRLDTEFEYRQMWVEIDPQDGSYRFDDVPPGGHVLDAVVEGYAPGHLDPVKVDPPRTDEFRFDLVVEQGVTLTGRITDAISGAPVTGAQVRLIAPSDTGYEWNAWLRESTTDGTGLYQIEQVPRGGRVAVAVDHGSHARLVEELQIAADAHGARLDIALPAGAIVRSWIEDAHGVPLPDATGYVINAGREIRRATSSAAGVLTFDRLEPGSAALSIESRGTATAYGKVLFRRELDLRPGETREVAFSWSSGARIHGRIECPDHRGKPRTFDLRVLQKGSGSKESRNTFAISDSEYQVFGILAGEHTVRIHSIDAGPRFMASREIEIQEGQDLAINFELGAARLEGTVTDLRDHPLAGVTVTARRKAKSGSSHSGESDVDGFFSVQGLTPGTYECVVAKQGYGRDERVVELAEPESTGALQVQLEPEALLRIAVKSRSGADLHPQAISCARLDSSLSDPTLPTTGIDSGGRFTFQQGRSGEYRIDITATGHFPAVLRVHLASGETRDLTASLRRLGNLEIRVENAHGTPLPGTLVTIRDRETSNLVADWIQQGRVQSTRPGPITDQDGRLLLQNLPEGEYTLEVPGTVRVSTVQPGATSTTVLVRL